MEKHTKRTYAFIYSEDRETGNVNCTGKQGGPVDRPELACYL